MNARRRSQQAPTPVGKVKNAGSSYGGSNQAKPIKNAVASQAKPADYKIARNSVTCKEGY